MTFSIQARHTAPADYRSVRFGRRAMCFGGGAPTPTPIEPPQTAATPGQVQQIQDLAMQRRRRLQEMQGMSSTVLTGSLGAGAPKPGVLAPQKTLLGGGG